LLSDVKSKALILVM